MKHKKSSRWHQGIAETALNFKPVIFTPLKPSQVATLYFPLAQLQAHTEIYLKSKGNLKPEDRDRHLIHVVREHPVKDVAIAACAHALSILAVRELIIGECRIDLITNDGILPYLRAITGVHFANPRAVSEDEAQRAQVLMQLWSPERHSIGKLLNTYFSISSSSGPSDLFLHPFVDGTIRRACAQLGGQLDIMKTEKRWKNAHEESFWLSGILRDNPTTAQLLNRTFPTWQTWALWKPNVQRLSLWERLTDEERGDLRDILALEGPDFLAVEKSTLLQGLVFRLDASRPCPSIDCGHLVVKLEDANGSMSCTMLNRLLDALDWACHTASPSSIALFTHLCARNPVDKRTLQLLELVNAISDSSVCTAVLKVLTGNANAKASVALELLPFLNDGPGRELRDILTPSLIASVEEEFFRKQNTLDEQLQRGSHAIATQLQALGRDLKNAIWLQPLFSDGMRSVLHIWPTKDHIDSVLNFRREISNGTGDANSVLRKKVDEYLMACLAGHGSVDCEARDHIESLLHFSQRAPDRHRQTAALAVAQLRNISAELRIQCLDHLKHVDKNFILEINQVLQKCTDMACVNFARILAEERWVKVERAACWRDVLLSMIEQRDATILDYSMSHLDVKHWFQWIDDLRKIFCNLTATQSPNILNPNLQVWTRRLSDNYTTVLANLEKSASSLLGFRWILTGWEDSRNIILFLDLLQQPEDGPFEPARHALISRLSSDGSNSRQICDVLAQLIQTTSAGTQAYQRVLEVHKKATGQATEAVLTVWLDSSELTVADRAAIEAMATVLGIQMPGSGDMLRKHVEDASKNAEIDYEELLDEATRLENLRLTLKAHDSGRTSELLTRIGIEDLPIAKDSYSGIPVELLDVVERVGDGEYEMSFLLTHLKPLNRIAHGLGNARMLVVRLAVGDGTSFPRFCIHLHPNPHTGGSHLNEISHIYHMVVPDGLQPDRQICHGRANRVAYQLSRALHRELAGGFRSLDLVHKSLASSIDNLSQTCIVCGNPLAGNQWRSTTCKKQCSLVLRRSDLEVRLVDLQGDPSVIDLLLCSVYAAAVDGMQSRLLVGCPIGDANTLRQVVTSVPTISHTPNTQSVSFVKGLGSQVEALLSWLCTSHRGFLATVTEALKIPSLPGVHQFVLANSAPEIEQDFAVHLSRQQSTSVVFHGTSLDRLYPILREGLKVQSGGPLQRHGAVMGRGIYAANEPSTALGYATSSSYCGRAASTFQNVRVLLGCELAGHGPGRNGVHVIPDSSMVIVRYVFLFPAQATVPIAAHVVPALTIAFSMIKLRSG